MTQVKTFVTTIDKGYKEAFNYLDKEVSLLGKVKIEKLEDSLYNLDTKTECAPCIVRLICYEPLKEKEGKNPTLDTKLKGFITKPEQEEILGGRLVRSILNSNYWDPIEGRKRVKTIRDLLKTYYSVGWSKKSLERINTVLVKYDLPQMSQNDFHKF